MASATARKHTSGSLVGHTHAGKLLILCALKFVSTSLLYTLPMWVLVSKQANSIGQLATHLKLSLSKSSLNHRCRVGYISLMPTPNPFPFDVQPCEATEGWLERIQTKLLYTGTVIR